LGTDISDGGEYHIVAAEVPDRGNSIENIGDFSCTFGFQQRFDDFSAFPAYDDAFYEGALTTDPCDNGCYLVQGQNEAGILDVETTTAGFSGQGYIEQGRGRDMNYDISNPFKHFPTGTESGPSGGGDSSGVRNPLSVCRIRGDCPQP
jgi:hypothetical protein